MGKSFVIAFAGVMLLGWMLLATMGCTGDESTPGTSPQAASGAPSFEEVTAGSGLTSFKHDNGGYGQSLMPEIVGGGGGFLDFDNDGWQDILLVAGSKWMHQTDEHIQGLYLYKNLGNGQFEDVTEIAGLSNVYAYGFGVNVADYDNDGDADFFLTTLHQNKLFRNDGGQFMEVGEEAGIADVSVWSTSSVFFDADNDGWLDLYVGNYVEWSPESDLNCEYEGEKVFCTPQEYSGRASHFYHNNGDGTFSNQTAERGFWTGVDTTLDKTLGVAMFDFNEDGWIDITTGNDTENDMLFINNGDGTFSEAGLQSGIAVSQHGVARAGMGLDTGVVDSTGLVSIFVGNFSDETVSVFRYRGNGQFWDRAAISRLSMPSMRTLAFGLTLADFDLDTDLDLLTANGHVLMHINRIQQAVTFRQPPQIYLNRGNGIFDEFTDRSSGLAKPMVARALAYADYDRDGDLDVLFVENNGPAHLFRNNTAGGASLRIRVVGTAVNRDAVGVRVQAVVDGLTMERLVKTGSSFLAASEKTLTFGLGRHNKVDTLRVFWPPNAGNAPRVDEFYDVKGKQTVLLKEGAESYETGV